MEPGKTYLGGRLGCLCDVGGALGGECGVVLRNVTREVYGGWQCRAVLTSEMTLSKRWTVGPVKTTCPKLKTLKKGQH